MAFQVGERIGDYEVVAILGAGGMGQVYKVQNIISKRVEAMKVLLPNLESDPSLGERFMQEIQVQASLDHPNIASLHTAQRVGNQLVMVMEYVEGTTVDTLLKEGPLPVPRSLEYTIQVLSALAYAHAHGVVHRDIKPANMMLTPSGAVKLMDFGIAKMADRQLTRTGHTVGSLFYMSPEQINNPHALDARSDLYSLGISMYEMVTGRRPFLGDSDYSIMLGHLARPAEPPIEVDPRLPQELSDVILMAIAKDMEKRFQSADAMKRALESIYAGIAPAPSVQAAASTPLPGVINTVPMAPPAGAVRAAPPAGAPRMAPPAAQPPPPASRRGLYLALGSVATVVVLALAAWQAPKLFRSSAAAPALQTEAPQPAVQQPPPAAPVEPPAVATQEPTVSSPQEAAPTPAAQTPAPAVKPARQPAHAAGAPRPAASTSPVTEPPSPQTQPPAAQQAQSQSAAAPAPDAAALREVRKQLMMLATRAKTLNSTIDQLKNEQARMGLGLRGDIVNAQHRMEMFLDEAEADMRSGDVEEAKKNLEAADREIDKLEKFLGR